MIRGLERHIEHNAISPDGPFYRHNTHTLSPVLSSITKNKMMAVLFLFTIMRLDPAIESQGFSNNWVFMILLHYLKEGQKEFDVFQSQELSFNFLLRNQMYSHSQKTIFMNSLHLFAPALIGQAQFKIAMHKIKSITSREFFLIEFYRINRICKICRILTQ